ncbi:penicillin-binding protein 2 [Telmatospirillum sp. J64-1]|uniref:peptidoglycan D,D-transpeptidase FtsI family protein n=1 Tax=Telmatospirillum sp. J64-1 TaxID=2502183 RepID=UPI0021072F01|nr:penicillin-binding protein 2 [Telmatospirillum sp. J64-1]
MIGRLATIIKGRAATALAPPRDPSRGMTESQRAEAQRRRAIETGRNRLLFTGIMFTLAFAVIAGRMVDLTVLKGGETQVRQQARMARTAPLEMGRADIVDRNGVVLATSLPTVSLYANANEVLDPEEAAAKLVRVLPDLSRADVQARLSAPRNFVYLKRNLTPREQYEVNALGIPGLYFERGERRIYPHGGLFSHVLGLTDIDNNGIAGLEKTFDGLLKSGTPLRLALDARVQTVMRNELLRAVETFSAIGAIGMVMDVHTGEIISMVSLPDFDPNNPGATTAENMFNRATLGVYEMGSTFKLLNTAIALDSGKSTLQSVYDASKPLRVARFTISDFHGKNRPLTVPEVLMHSSNIASAKMAIDYGTETQRAYMGALGMLRTAAIELPEVGSPLVPSPWREINTMTISYGHGIAVTPLQVVTGVSALVNGGILRPATLVKHEPGAEPAGQRVLKEQTSYQMRQLMRLTVMGGSGSMSEVPGYHVGGKTGTAEKLGAGGTYRRKSLLSSFIAAFPMHDPRYVVLAMIDEPQGTKETFGYATGGWTAAPAVGRVISQIGPMLGVPSTTEDQAEAVLPIRYLHTLTKSTASASTE